MNINAAYEWRCHPEAEALLQKILDAVCHRNHFAESLSCRLLTETSTRLFDWLDHVLVGYSHEFEHELEELGFTSEMETPVYRVFHHAGAQLPRVVLFHEADPKTMGIAVSVESIADFLMAYGRSAEIEGSPLGGYRRCCISTEMQATVWVVERRAVISMEPTMTPPEYLSKYYAAKEKWKTRSRDLSKEDESITQSIEIAKEIIQSVGHDLAAWIILECERELWQSRNTAAQIQKNRQDRLGMGWANHDHHTFRSSRRHFSSLVHLFELLGFYCRERFYAGEEAGWGAQVMENPRCRLVLFLDVDLLPEELAIDLAHQPLPEIPRLGTIGLWCALHGDSILKAGMHHLEAQFMFDELKSDLKEQGVGMMEPFSNFPYLRQAFTQGEIWAVDPQRVQGLVDKRIISKEQAEQFLSRGALGSHLENLQRREGFKGFNQKNVSLIIKKTDPRLISG